MHTPWLAYSLFLRVRVGETTRNRRIMNMAGRCWRMQTYAVMQAARHGWAKKRPFWKTDRAKKKPPPWLTGARLAGIVSSPIDDDDTQHKLLSTSYEHACIAIRVQELSGEERVTPLKKGEREMLLPGSTATGACGRRASTGGNRLRWRWHELSVPPASSPSYPPGVQPPSLFRRPEPRHTQRGRTKRLPGGNHLPKEKSLARLTQGLRTGAEGPARGHLGIREEGVRPWPCLYIQREESCYCYCYLGGCGAACSLQID